jgi:hypothetical protein
MGADPATFEKPSGLGGSEERYHESLRLDVARFERELEEGR